MIVSYAKAMSELVKKAAETAKEKGIDIGPCGKMCSECAFKWEQDHTLQYIMAADLAAKILIEGGEFNCHTYDYKDANKPCSGFSIIKAVWPNETFEEGELQQTHEGL